ncbi:unnamed protein product [Paramecium octaurelia]|uniref:Uncharacterized protein n=1 Tax=Paramecium octaurelia TaxID=43137 RepID=A0A8S1XJV8_PAROT|nr:unnamed protein product [Paramecium octaurelia]
MKRFFMKEAIYLIMQLFQDSYFLLILLKKKMLNHENQEIPQDTSEITSVQENYLNKTIYLIEMFKGLQDMIQEIKQPSTNVELIDAISPLFYNPELDQYQNHQASEHFNIGQNMKNSPTLQLNSIIETPSGRLYGCYCHSEQKKYYPTPQALGGHIRQYKKNMNKQN